MTTEIRLVIADDHPLLRAGLRQVIESDARLKVLAEADDGETALLWALAGFGILLRSAWDAHEHLQSGKLVQVLEDWTLPAADVYAVYPERLHLSAKVGAFIDFLGEWFGETPEWSR